MARSRDDEPRRRGKRDGDDDNPDRRPRGDDDDAPPRPRKKKRRRRPLDEDDEEAQKRRRYRDDDEADDDLPRRLRGPERTGLDWTFADTNFGLLVLFAILFSPLALVVGLLGLQSCTDDGARAKALVTTILGGLVTATLAVLYFTGALG